MIPMIQRFPRFSTNFVIVEAWRKRQPAAVRMLRMYYTKRELVIVYQ